jgi:hypothetical protein
MVTPTTYRRPVKPVPEAICSKCGDRDVTLTMDPTTQVWSCIGPCGEAYGLRAAITKKVIAHPVVSPSAARFLAMHGYEVPEPPRESRLGAIARRIRG